MVLATGTRLGPYEILGPIGAGGMGEVYKARDTRLDRTVAIKVLPAHLADAEYRARFEREARTVAALSHPNICSLHDVGEYASSLFLVMEHLVGETLADRLRKGALPIPEALETATQIAEALSAAHRAGIIHRDLKPGNIMLTRTGVKLLDFGLAKLKAPSAQPAFATGAALPTQSEPLTGRGTILGTLHYMAPEQLEGKDADARTDIWALGLVLYEMVTGKRAFEANSEVSLIGAILERTPEPVSASRPLTPPGLDRLVRRILAKSPDDRPDTAHDIVDDLKWIQEGIGIGDSGRTQRRNTATIPWLVAAVAIVAGVAVWWATGRRAAPGAVPLRLDVTTPPTSDLASAFALSPDGRSIVFVALKEQTPQLWLRRLDEAESQLLPETEGASYPFWSPTSRSIAFFAGGLLKRLDLGGGRPKVLAHARNPSGGSWSRGDFIIYSPSRASPLLSVPSTGGRPVAVTRFGPDELSHRFPAFLPDGKRFLFLVMTSAATDGGLFLGSTEASSTPYRLVAAESAAEYSPDGHLLMVRDGALVAVPFDVTAGRLSGDPVTLAPRVAESQGRGAFSVSASGLAAYRAGRMSSAASELVWTQRDGTTSAAFPAIGFVSSSRDGKHIAVTGQTELRTLSNTDIWLIDTARGVPRRFTFDPAFEVSTVWSPDSSRLVFASNRRGVFDVFEKPADFARDERLLLETPANKFPSDWSPDGQVLLFVSEDAVAGDDLWTVSLEEPRKLVRLLGGSYDESQGQFSPDGRWLAYRSNESGQWEIYVRPYPGPGSQQLVSRGGGIQPRWRQDGRELFYVAADSRMMAVPIHLPLKGEALEIGAPVPLFTARLRESANQQFGFIVDPAGQRFLMSIVADQTSTTPITIVQNWAASLAK